MLMEFLRHIYYLLCKYLFVLLPDKTFFRLIAWITYKRFGLQYYRMNFDTPVSFNEKLNFLKINQQNPLGTLVADKIAVRAYVEKKVGAKYLIPLLGTYQSASAINFDELPDAFVLKANHGSGWNIVCTSKALLDRKGASKKLNRWLSYNAYFLSREYQYKNIPPAIICEQFLRYNIEDYKIFCFNGEPAFIQIDIGRFTKHERAYYNTDWQKLDFSICYPIAKESIAMPPQFSEMLQVARVLSSDFVFARVDLYLHEDHIYFGEITLFPEGGRGPFLKKEDDFKIGALLNVGGNEMEHTH